MMNKPANSDATEAATGDFKRLPAGGHHCVIKAARVTKSKKGNDMLELRIDIAAPDEFAGYFTERYKHFLESDPQAKWPSDGTYRQLTEGNSLKFFKGMIVNLEKSNPGWQWHWDESELPGKKFGGVFQEEKYIGNDNKEHTSVKCVSIRPDEGIEGVTVPTPKDNTQNGTNAPYGAFTGAQEEIPF